MIWSCSKVLLTRRRQFKLLPETMLISASSLSYQQVLDTANIIRTGAQAEMVKRVGNNISEAVARQVFNTVFGVGGQVGMLAFSRKHESESDEMDIMFMTMAGYNPSEAPVFWDRMAQLGGELPPVMLSTRSHTQRPDKKILESYCQQLW